MHCAGPSDLYINSHVQHITYICIYVYAAGTCVVETPFPCFLKPCVCMIILCGIIRLRGLAKLTSSTNFNIPPDPGAYSGGGVVTERPHPPEHLSFLSNLILQENKKCSSFRSVDLIRMLRSKLVREF